MPQTGALDATVQELLLVPCNWNHLVANMAPNGDDTAGDIGTTADVNLEVSKLTNASSPDRHAATMAADEPAIKSSEHETQRSQASKQQQQQPSEATEPRPDQEAHPDQPSPTISLPGTPANMAVAPSSSELRPFVENLETSEDPLSKNQMKKRAKIQRCTRIS